MALTPLVRLVKRAVDVVGAGVGLALTAPLYPLIGTAIVLDSPGPLFYRQRRAGQLIGGEPGRLQFAEFHMLKFRTMRPDAEKSTGAVLAAENDPRITRVGRFLRKTRLDELPQFWNVLKGQMSIVGPRPERPELLANLAMAIPFFEERMRNVKPGITGLAQVSLGYSGRAPDGSPDALRPGLLGGARAHRLVSLDRAEGDRADADGDVPRPGEMSSPSERSTMTLSPGARGARVRVG
jgi:lipopolysaccharide/colanic/teichoic acid biosynthesis glycosyltransferase